MSVTFFVCLHSFTVIVLGDISGGLHQWGEGEDFSVNNYSYDSLPIVDPFPEPTCEMSESR